MDIDQLAKTIRACKKCKLSLTRRNAVPGEGNPHSDVMIIGEAPGATEDETGRPFVGSAGKLLDQLLKRIGLDRDKVYITNLVKCRPPNNRDPDEEEITACSPYLDLQIALIKPKVIVTLGNHSTSYILGKIGVKDVKISRVRGRFYDWGDLNVLVFPTYHPAAALYNPRLKRVLEEDFDTLGRRISSKRVTIDSFFDKNGLGNKEQEGNSNSSK
ncbi:MAG: uracil-DNA glycosylase [Candidatus Aramenus sp.]|nr:uracil-DNA glycosylase [Candidatus Aramenus sp.]